MGSYICKYKFVDNKEYESDDAQIANMVTAQDKQILEQIINLQDLDSDEMYKLLLQRYQLYDEAHTTIRDDTLKVMYMYQRDLIATKAEVFKHKKHTNEQFASIISRLDSLEESLRK